ncbi:hypothetical protein EYM_07000 [Ignicoccus islandicus DSM 13165]|uniref:Uncharacterized protein n=2 Tax=Ignicoccus islandicus TaxID=54259 RepID=A0A0U3FS76_9CREN|nr:hypothetical protein EYM_07000 [Ignicoccus islandicus DSM 13165]
MSHCDLKLEDGKIVLELLGSRMDGKGRKGLSKSMDLLLYKIEKEKRKKYGLKEKLLELDLNDVKCWRVEEHTGKGLSREYPNTFLFLIRDKRGNQYRILVSNKVFKLFMDTVVKQLRRMEIGKCS